MISTKSKVTPSCGPVAQSVASLIADPRSSILGQPHILWRLINEYFLWSLFCFCWFKIKSESMCMEYWLNAQEKYSRSTNLLNMTRAADLKVKPLTNLTNKLSHGVRFPTMWYVRPAKTQISLHIWAVWPELWLVTWKFYACYATDWTKFGVSKLKRRLHSLIWVYTCQNAILLKSQDTALIKAGLWKYHAWLVRPGPISFRTSRKFLFTCPWTSTMYKVNTILYFIFWWIITSSHLALKTVWILISWLLQKPADLDLHCFQEKPADQDPYCLQKLIYIWFHTVF